MSIIDRGGYSKEVYHLELELQVVVSGCSKRVAYKIDTITNDRCCYGVGHGPGCMHACTPIKVL